LSPVGPGPHAFTEAPIEHYSKTSRLLLEAAQICGYKAMIEPEFGYVGRIEANGRRFHYKGGLFDINSSAASGLTRDKAYSFGLMKEEGVRFPATRSFFSPEFEAFALLRGGAAALRYARELGYPVFVKANEGSRAFGAHRADNDDQLCWALGKCFARKEGRVTLVQDFIEGQELRLLVVDGEVQLGYYKRPLLLRGDGSRTVLELLKDAQEVVRELKGGTKTFDLDDSRIIESLQRRQIRLDSRPDNEFLLSDGLSLEMARGVEIIENPSPQMRDTARRSMKALGLRYGSVDAMETESGELVVIELNSAPGVTGLASLGHQDRAVELYCKVLRAYFEG
jgi:glutathione synthase/RimK-type ligase-like ATP-grasp enzyme